MKAPGDESDETQLLFECKEPGCSYVYATFDMLQDHVNFREHGLNVQPQEGIYDRLRRLGLQVLHTFSYRLFEKRKKSSLQVRNVPHQKKSGNRRVKAGHYKSRGEEVPGFRKWLNHS